MRKTLSHIKGKIICDFIGVLGIKYRVHSNAVMPKTNRKQNVSFEKCSMSILIFCVCIMFTACGKPDTEKEIRQEVSVKINLDYEKVSLTSNTPMNVYIDEEKIGRQEAGTEKTYDISLTQGEHDFYMKNDGIYETKRLQFKITDKDQSISFGAKTNLTLGVKVWNAE